MNRAPATYQPLQGAAGHPLVATWNAPGPVKTPGQRYTVWVDFPAKSPVMPLPRWDPIMVTVRFTVDNLPATHDINIDRLNHDESSPQHLRYWAYFSFPVGGAACHLVSVTVNSRHPNGINSSTIDAGAQVTP